MSNQVFSPQEGQAFQPVWTSVPHWGQDRRSFSPQNGQKAWSLDAGFPHFGQPAGLGAAGGLGGAA